MRCWGGAGACVLEKKGTVLEQESLPFLAVLLLFAILPAAARVQNLSAQIGESTFPWLCSNCWHKHSGEPLAGGKEACVIYHGGYKIGVVGLIEDDWLACCASLDPKTLAYTDFVEVGRAIATKLKADEGCDYVVALTHFREPNDERLAAEAPEIDLVLGGHDHHYASKCVEPHGTWYVKSGADFRYVRLQLQSLWRIPTAAVS